MIKSLTVVNHRGESLKITLTEADPAHGLLIQKITGIGPADANLNFSDYATNDGSEFNSAKLDKRSIQITFILSDEDPKMTIERARHNAYKYFQTKKNVRLIFETDERTSYVEGRVEHLTPDVFSQKETVTVDVTCGDPLFYKIIDGHDTISVDVMSVLPAFHFNVEDGDLDTPYEVSTYASPGDLIETINYDGEIENGFIGHVLLVGELQGDIILARYNTSEYFKISKDKLEALEDLDTLRPGDEIVFSTEPKHNYAKIIQNGRETNILNAVDLAGSTWLLLNPGENTFVYSVTDGVDYTQLTIDYKTLLQGV